ncbi:MAG TPA: hypothetical protein EYN67_02035 [Flavobacteriales bacterium]|nr:hypothetical protein [Flavobacteriales bacterium]
MLGFFNRIFLPGLSEIEQLQEEFIQRNLHSQSQHCPKGGFQFHLLHSIIDHETQSLALKPPPANKAKVILSTNIAESSITIPDVRYIIDFGVVRKLLLDDDRSMLALVNTYYHRTLNIISKPITPKLNLN